MSRSLSPSVRRRRARSALLTAVLVVAAPLAPAAADELRAEVPAFGDDRFVPAELRHVQVAGTVHLVDVDPFFDEDDHCEIDVSRDLLVVAAEGGSDVTQVGGDCDGAHMTLTAAASSDGSGEVTVRVSLRVTGDANFPIADTGAWDDLYATVDVAPGLGGATDVHLDAGESSHAGGTADLTVSVG